MFGANINYMLVLVLAASGIKSIKGSVSAEQMRRDIAIVKRELEDLKHTVSKRSYSNPGNSYKYSTDPPLTWPSGLYWLPRPLSGCPTSTTQTWVWGYFNVKTASKATRILDIPNFDAVLLPDRVAGYEEPWYLQKICSKVSGEKGKEWPKGNYCIGMYAWYSGPDGTGSCPAGFGGGRMYFGYDKAGMFNFQSAIIDYYGITIYFCCRNDGSSLDMIELPRHEPFLLYGYKGGCQLVKGMSVSTGFVRIAIRPGLNIFDIEYHPHTTLTDDGKLMFIKMCSYRPSRFPQYNQGL